MIKTYQITENIILRDFLKKTDLSNSLITQITTGNGHFIVNDMHVDKSYCLAPGDELAIVIPVTKTEENIKSVYHDFEIVYEDSYLLIINKENDLSVIPTNRYFNNSLANFVASYYKRKGMISNIHFVNRLDKKTSGLIILAKNIYVNELMKQTKIIKKYLLEVEGILEKDEGTIETGIIRPSAESIKRAVTFDKINSKTTYQVVKKKEKTTIVLATLHTGKTHQLRVHFSYLNHPIIGDDLYSSTSEKCLKLHSYYLEFIHPITKEIIELKTVPSWFDQSDLAELHQLDHN